LPGEKYGFERAPVVLCLPIMAGNEDDMNFEFSIGSETNVDTPKGRGEAPPEGKREYVGS
jgi:hypothetical protein